MLIKFHYCLLRHFIVSLCIFFETGDVGSLTHDLLILSITEIYMVDLKVTLELEITL